MKLTFTGVFIAFVVTAIAVTPPDRARAGPPADAARRVQQLLSDKCFSCHGPDERARKAGVRFDTRAGLAESGSVVAGKAAESELYRRIVSTGADDVMPPRKTRKPLTADEITLVRDWIDRGAKWETHWSFTPPKRPAVPAVSGRQVANGNAIDAFVLSRLESEGLKPSPEAPKHTLIRRLSFDLTGLPPTPAEVDAFAADPSPRAYEALVDRLLASDHYGERMAMDWLDAARYSDTDGFQDDAARTNWPWRDWVAAAFNRNTPFDQFTLEQFAGDLLPTATQEQKLATAFHRNHMTNGEGGRDPEESRIDYVIDRVNTVGTAWLGLTLGCTQCHDHKYDPITQKDYYSLAAFFDNIDETGEAGKKAKPFLPYQSLHAVRAVASAEQLVNERRRDADAAQKAAEPAFAAWVARRVADVRGGDRAWRAFVVDRLESVEGTELSQEPDGVVTAEGPNPKHDDYRITGRITLPRVTGFRLDVLSGPKTQGKLGRSESGHFIVTDIKVQVRHAGREQVREVPIASAVADYSADPKKNDRYGDVRQTLDDDPRNGWANFDRDPTEPRTAVFAFAEPQVLEAGEEITIELRHRSTRGHSNTARFRLSVTDQRGDTVRGVGTAPVDALASVADASAVPADVRAKLFEQFLEDYPPYVAVKATLDRAAEQLDEAKAAQTANVMVLAERENRRDTHVLVRGEWDKKGDKVAPDTPAAFEAKLGDREKPRASLARWLTSRDNPLTARVVVNRLWQQTFGVGLVRTPEDFGLQGDRPTHPELLDWLAVELMESGWDVKHVLRLIVRSATYRQRSDACSEDRVRDPENRLLARQTRFRLPSWMIRDAALRAGGLLNPAVGGPPVRPYQPVGVWEEQSMGKFKYTPTDGPEQYRRTLYAFWRRSAVPAFLFDAAQRRSCEVHSSRTNTPLHALTLLNDLTYVESARAVAGHAMNAAPDEAGRLKEMARRVLSRSLDEREAAVLVRELRRAQGHYREHRSDAVRSLAAGQSKPDVGHDPVELAAYAVAAGLLLNLDEAIIRE